MHSLTSIFMRYLRMKTSTTSTTFHELVERRTPSIRRGSATREGDRKILLDELVVDTADGVCGIVRGSAIGVLLAGIDKLNKAAIKSTSVVCPARNLISESMMAECPTDGHGASGRRINLLEAGALHAHEHETSLMVNGIDTTSSQLIADLIAKGRRQIMVPREHPPRPEFRTHVDELLLIEGIKTQI